MTLVSDVLESSWLHYQGFKWTICSCRTITISKSDKSIETKISTRTESTITISKSKSLTARPKVFVWIILFDLLICYRWFVRLRSEDWVLRFNVLIREDVRTKAAPFTNQLIEQSNRVLYSNKTLRNWHWQQATTTMTLFTLNYKSFICRYNTVKKLIVADRLE